MVEYQCKMCGAPMFSEKAQNNRMFCSKKCFGAHLRMKNEEKFNLQNDPELGKLTNVTDEGFAALIGAIVEKARMDYLKMPVNSHYWIDAEHFFLTTYEKLTGYDGREMLDRLDKERKERKKKKRKENSHDFE